jgi:hypothetical protein
VTAGTVEGAAGRKTADGDGARAVLGLDTGAVDLKAADAVLHALARGGLPADAVGCTHLIRGEHPHVAVTVEVAADRADHVWGLLRAAADAAPGNGAAHGGLRHGAAPAAETAGAAAAAHVLGGGRAVFFPGVGGLTGTVTVQDLLDRTSVTRVTVLGGGTAEDSALVVTRNHVRPERRGGELVLVLTPTAGGRLAPFEVPDPTPCCVDHG